MGYSYVQLVLCLAFVQIADSVSLLQRQVPVQKPDPHLVDIGEQLTKQHEAIRKERLAKEQAAREAAQHEKGRWLLEPEEPEKFGATGRAMQKRTQETSSVVSAEEAAFKRAVAAAAASILARSEANASKDAGASAGAEGSAEAKASAAAEEAISASSESSFQSESLKRLEGELRPAAGLLPSIDAEAQGLAVDTEQRQEAEEEQLAEELRQQKRKKFQEDQGRVDSEERIFTQKIKNVQQFKKQIENEWKEEERAETNAKEEAEVKALREERINNVTKERQAKALAARRAAKKAAGIVPTYVDPAVQNRLGQKAAEKGVVFSKMAEEKKKRAEHAKWLQTPEGKTFAAKERREKAREERRLAQKAKSQASQDEFEARQRSRIEQVNQDQQLRMTKRFQDKQGESRNFQDRQRKRIEEELDRAVEDQLKGVEAIATPKEQLTDLGKVDMIFVTEALSSISTAVKDPEFMEAVNNASSALKSSVINFAHKADARVKMFVRGSQNATQGELAKLLSELLFGSAKGFQDQLSDVNIFLEKVQGTMPGKLKTKVAPFLGMVTPKSVAFDVDAAKLANISFSKACGQVTSVVDQLTPLHANLTGLRSVLNQSAKYVPVLDSLLPSLDPAVTTLAGGLVSLAFTETLALESAASDLLKTAGPIIVDKFHCALTDTSNGARAALGLLALWGCLSALL